MPLINKTNLIFSIRVAILISIFGLVFYMKFFLSATSQQKSNKPNENSFSTGKILSTDFSLTQYEQQQNCSLPAILDFPPDGFSKEQRQHGWIAIHIVLLLYGFWFLVVVCDDYLVPSIEEMCSDLNIENDMMRATIMAAAISSPALFMNFIGTFITKGDLGVSTIMGSALFNLLAVPACCGLFAVKYFKLNWWSITRDGLMYLILALALFGILRDGQVWWYEALALVIAYFLNILTKFYYPKLCRQLKIIFKKSGYYQPQYKEVNEFTYLLDKSGGGVHICKGYTDLEQGLNNPHIIMYLEQHERPDFFTSARSGHYQNLWEYYLDWPINFLLWLTMPHCREHKFFKCLTFVLATLWMAGISYFLAFDATIIGDTLNIPDTIMGLTILAVGTSTPEAVCSIIITREGLAGRDPSRTLGYHTFDILLSLGLPWFIKAIFLPDADGHKVLPINATSLTSASVMLFPALLGFYMILVWNKFVVNRRVGVACALIYLGVMIVAVLVQLNVFFPVNLPKCSF